jgi:hypothetical protein
LTYRPPNKNRPAVGQGGDQPNNWNIRLSTTNGKLFISAVKIVVAKKVDKLACVHVILDCNGVEQMCQAIKQGLGGWNSDEYLEKRNRIVGIKSVQISNFYANDLG